MFLKSNPINLFIMRRVFRRRLWQADALAEVLPNEEVYFAELVGGGVSFGENPVTSMVEKVVAAATITITVSSPLGGCPGGGLSRGEPVLRGPSWTRDGRVPGHRSGDRGDASALASAGSGWEFPLTNDGDDFGQDGGVIAGN
ncbi:uncharacterized protein LOC128092380 [Culex pipiens pallens]|uniref:uncharacterized protein LOC128092380 n=1 Tax=Culex pipiens pallens TaxID=42434 RepID=UPI0022AA5183|nr:uncharacterized protein LOC128092380 [Culex pipiens pallens]